MWDGYLAGCFVGNTFYRTAHNVNDRHQPYGSVPWMIFTKPVAGLGYIKGAFVFIKRMATTGE